MTKPLDSLLSDIPKQQHSVGGFSYSLKAGAIGVVAAFSLAAGAEDARTAECFSAPYDCSLSGDIDPATARSYEDLYAAYAAFAWQDFIALNFPAQTDSQGDPVAVPSTTNGLNYNNGDYIAVWQVYPEARDIFLPNGVAPAAFGAGHVLPAICSGLDPDDGASSLTKKNNVLDEYVQANRMGPIIDQNGLYARFGINFNETMYNYVIEHQLYNKEGQEAFDANDPDRDDTPVDWPRGVFSSSNDPSKVGSIMVKASWKLLTGADDATKYYRTNAYIYEKAGGAFGDEPTVKESCIVSKVGLVGFHIVHRTNSSPIWVWSTFEHVDNAPWLVDFASGTPSGSYSFFDPTSCASVSGVPSCSFNQQPPRPWNPQRSYAEPKQMIRLAAPGQYAQIANGNYRAKLKAGYSGGTVWENYFLTDVQFPTVVKVTDPSTGLAEINPAYPDGLPTPTFLANSTLETYIQGFYAEQTTTNGNIIPVSDQMQNVVVSGSTVDPFAVSIFNHSGGAQRNTSSCVGCHGDSSMVTGASSNFVFSLNRAERSD
ncbi:hypothetical protein [Pelagibius sp. Alg239-R121]|uniref:hypothetical protein n=1 Tax=Pelagibius sp. Alg239-R121 TaxID=2993448 RepID=UPI0024A6FF9A|nr:hypothetical protein [Pelagibius sp. Alg239-R121]